MGYGCSNDTADKAIEETRRLMEQQKADILIGPLSGDEGIAVANYAKDNPDKTFINGTSGAQDATLKVQAPNFFRFHSDGAQWAAGLGDYAYNKLGWKTAAVIGDDYSFPYTSLAGFIAEFCALGGKVTKRIWPALGEKDYSSFISQIPKDVDGVMVGIGGSGLISFIKQYRQQRGDIDPKKIMGNVFWPDPLILKEIGAQINGAYTAQPTAPDSTEAAATEYVAKLDKAYGKAIADTASSVFTYNYYNAMQGLVSGPRAGQGRHLGRPEGAPAGARQDRDRRRLRQDHARRQPQRRGGQLRRSRSSRATTATRPRRSRRSRASSRRSPGPSRARRRRRTARTRSARRAAPRPGWGRPSRSRSGPDGPLSTP